MKQYIDLQGYRALIEDFDIDICYFWEWFQSWILARKLTSLILELVSIFNLKRQWKLVLWCFINGFIWTLKAHCCCLLNKPCPTLQPHGLQPARCLCPQDFLARTLEWAAASFSRDLPDQQTEPTILALGGIGRWIITAESPGKPRMMMYAAHMITEGERWRKNMNLSGKVFNECEHWPKIRYMLGQGIREVFTIYAS